MVRIQGSISRIKLLTIIYFFIFIVRVSNLKSYSKEVSIEYVSPEELEFAVMLPTSASTVPTTSKSSKTPVATRFHMCSNETKV
jgi:hypothetical protein